MLEGASKGRHSDSGTMLTQCWKGLVKTIIIIIMGQTIRLLLGVEKFTKNQYNNLSLNKIKDTMSCVHTIEKVFHIHVYSFFTVKIKDFQLCCWSQKLLMFSKKNKKIHPQPLPTKV